MRMMITISLEKSTLPRDYRPLICRLLQMSLQNQGGDSLVHQYFSAQTGKHYSFSVYLPKSRFRDGIELENGYIKVIFSTYDESTYDDFFLAAMGMQNETLALEDNGFCFTSVIRIYEKAIENSSATIHMLSPLVIRNAGIENQGHRRCLGIRDETFEQQLRSCVADMLGVAGKRQEMVETLRVMPCEEDIGSKEAHVLHRGRFYRTTLGNMRIFGEPEMLNLLYQGGMGEMREEGFGLFELIG